MTDELLMVVMAVLYAVIGTFLVTDAWFGNKISGRIRKMFGKRK
jgi:hypothetical protein